MMKRKSRLLTVFLAVALMLAAFPAAAQQYTSYVTQPGDYLSKVALRFCTTWQAIYNANRQSIGDNPNILNAGIVLTIPANCDNGGGSSVPSPGGSGVYDRGRLTHASGSTQGNTYFVAWGDTFFSIGQRFGLSADALMRANNVARPNNLSTGQRLIIPGLQSGAVQLPIVVPPVVQAPSISSRTFSFGECTIQFNSSTNVWNTPNGSVIASIDVGTFPSVQVQQINGALWYQIEYIETTSWVPAYVVATIGSCGL